MMRNILIGLATFLVWGIANAAAWIGGGVMRPSDPSMLTKFPEADCLVTANMEVSNKSIDFNALKIDFCFSTNKEINGYYSGVEFENVKYEVGPDGKLYNSASPGNHYGSLSENGDFALYPLGENDKSMVIIGKVNAGSIEFRLNKYQNYYMKPVGQNTVIYQEASVDLQILMNKQ